jgi:site-specific DNA recombinase
MNMQNAPIKSGVSWAQDKVRRILLNCNYVGHVRHHVGDKEKEYSVDGHHEPIISHELFRSAQKLLEKNRKTSPSKKPSAEKYFSGFLLCAHCGYKLGAYNATKPTKTGAVYHSKGYRCVNRPLRACGTGSIAHGKVEEAFHDYISQVSKLDVTAEIKQLEREQKKRDNASLISSYEKKLQQLDSKERETLSLYVDNDIDFAAYREIKKRIDADKQVIRVELGRLREVQDDVEIDEADIIEQLNENWLYLSNMERRQFLLQFVENITVDISKDGHFAKVNIVDLTFR